MPNYANPFEYDQAATIRPNFVRDVFIEDHNYTRFIRSNRNVFIVGERGSGKSMTLFYNSASVQKLKADQSDTDVSLEFVGAYVPCKTPLTQKPEHELLPEGEAAMVSEHIMVISIAHAIVKSLDSIGDPDILGDEASLRRDICYVLDIDLPDKPLLNALMLFLDRESQRSERALNDLRFNDFRNSAHTFASIVAPLINAFRLAPRLTNTHFMILVDDAHDLNIHQKKVLNSWLAYRERSSFSFKIAVADAYSYPFTTSTNGTILEGHDFLIIDLQKPFQNPLSDYGQLARDIIERRLVAAGINRSARDFFPESRDFRRDLERCRAEVEQEALARYPSEADGKKRTDYIGKYERVKYFRDRDPRANLPTYSGFDTIVNVSTGVVRNLLKPCYFMYDAVYSNRSEVEREIAVAEIPAKVQSDVIRDQSEALWKWTERPMASAIPGCTLELSEQVQNLFKRLGDLFRHRLMHAKSEPRALAFSISGFAEYRDKLEPILSVARRAQLLYVRSGPAKDGGRRESYYVPNRMLWPVRGLDVVGQNARVSLKARDLWAAAGGKAFPIDDEDAPEMQGGLFE